MSNAFVDLTHDLDHGKARVWKGPDGYWYCHGSGVGGEHTLMFGMWKMVMDVATGRLPIKGVMVP